MKLAFSRGGTESSVPSGRWRPGREIWGSAPEGSGQAALEKPGPNSSSPKEARQESGFLAGGPQGLWPEWEGVAVRGPWSALQPAPSSCLPALGYLRLGETQEGLRGACGSWCMAAFCTFSSGGEVLPETQHSVFQGVLQEQGGPKWGEQSAGYSGAF